MVIRNKPLHAPSSGLLSAVWAGVRLVLAVAAGLVLMLSALAFGVVVGSAVLLWNRLRGRRAHIGNVGMRGATPRPRARARQDDVIDVEARELV